MCAMRDILEGMSANAAQRLNTKVRIPVIQKRQGSISMGMNKGPFAFSCLDPICAPAQMPSIIAPVVCRAWAQ